MESCSSGFQVGDSEVTVARGNRRDTWTGSYRWDKMAGEVLISYTFHKLETWRGAQQTDSSEPTETQGFKVAVRGWRRPAAPSECSGGQW